MSKYEKIEEIILNMVRQQLLKPGDTVPPIREMASMYGMSVTPVIEAYHNLERRGILLSKPKSKFTVSPDAFRGNQSPSGPLEPRSALSSFSDIYHAVNDQDVEFPYGWPSYFSQDRANDTMLRRFSASLRTHSTPEELPIEAENPALKAELCKWMFKSNCMVEQQDILLLNSSTCSALMVILQCCLPSGGSVGIAAPADINHHMALRMKGLTPVSIRTISGAGLDLDNLELIIREHPEMHCIICAANVAVPTGAVMPEANKKRLAQICREHDILIIEDDRFGALTHDAYRPYPLMRYAPERTIYLGCVNFADAEGMQIHWICSTNFQQELRYYRNLMMLLPSQSMQSAYAETHGSNLARNRRTQVMQRDKENAAVLRNAVYRYFPADTYVQNPAGGHYLWIKLPAGCDSIELLKRSYRQSVTFSPGAMYSVDNEFSDYICMNTSVVDFISNWEEGVRRLGTLLHEMTESSNETENSKMNI